MGQKEEIMGYLRRATESMSSGDKRIIVSKSWKSFNTWENLTGVAEALEKRRTCFSFESLNITKKNKQETLFFSFVISNSISF